MIDDRNKTTLKLCTYTLSATNDLFIPVTVLCVPLPYVRTLNDNTLIIEVLPPSTSGSWASALD